MMLQEKLLLIATTVKKQNWTRACANNKINKWKLIDFVNELVYVSKDNPTIITIRNCRKCGEEFNIQIIGSKCFVKQMCRCGKDGTCSATLEKLEVFLTHEEAVAALAVTNLKKRAGLANTIEYWEGRGYDAVTAIEKAREVQKSRSEKSPSSKPGARGYSKRTREYWMNRGYSELEAGKKVAKTQVTNGLTFYVEKYGDVLGPKKFAARIEQWLNAPGNKNMVRGRSKKSVILFESLPPGGYYGENEKTIRGKTKVHRVDYVIGKAVIEFNGDYWHANPAIYPDGEKMIRTKKAKDIWLHDAAKVADLENAGYRVLTIWENDYLSDSIAVTNKCKEFLNAD